MENIETRYSQQKEISSDILFLKKEIDFLLKILKNCYSTSVQKEGLKKLDNFWRKFDANKDQLDILTGRLQKEKKSSSVLYQEDLIDDKNTGFKDNEIVERYELIETDMKSLKDSFYEFMQGCNACALKTH